MQIRRWVYYALYVPSLLLVAVYMCTLGLLTPFGRRMDVATLWGEFAGRFWLRWGAGIRVQIEGEDNIPEQGPYVILSNHQSEWETLFLPRILRPASIVLKKSLTNIPVYGWTLRLAHPIAIDRSSPKGSVRQILKQGTERILEGSNVLIFAEATRVAPASLRKYTRTGSKLAIEAGVSILPVVHNSGDCWSPKRWFKPGTITLRIGKPIESDGKSAADLTTEVESWARANYPGELKGTEEPAEN